MDTKRDEEFIILGQKVRLGPRPLNDEEENSLSSSEVVEEVRDEINKIEEKSPGLSKLQVAVLVALKLGSDKLIMEKELQDNIHKLELTAKDALELINEVSPPSH